jgi:hypothetical protein
MNITRHNYEDFFLLYIDNELSIAERKAVEEFVAQNQDLAQELVMLQETMLTPDDKVVFNNKEALMQPLAGETFIDVINYSEFFVLYADNELTNNEKAAVEEFVYRNPQFQEEFELLQQVKLSADTSIVFANKEILYRKEEDEKVVPFRWWRVAAAAILLLLAGLFWLNSRKEKTDNLAGANKQNNQAVTPTTSPVKKADEAINPQQNNDTPQKETIAAVKEKEQPASNETGNKKNNVVVPVKDNKQQVAVNNNQRTKKEEAISPLPVEKEKPLIAALNNDKDLKGTTVVKDGSKNVGTTNVIAATVKPLIIDRPTEYPVEEDKTKGTWASAGDDNTENVEVLNTSVNKQTPLRGFFRKASRLIAKRTNRGEDDGNRRGILIGGFEIAVK